MKEVALSAIDFPLFSDPAYLQANCLPVNGQNNFGYKSS